MQRTLIYLEKNISSVICGHLIWRRLYSGFCLMFADYIDGALTKEQPKQLDREHILIFLWKFWVVLGCFGLFRLFRFYTDTASFDVSIEPKQTEDQPKQFDREHILGCFGLFRNSPVCFGCFDIGSKQQSKPKQTKKLFLVSRNKPKHTRNRSCFELFRFEPNYFLFRAHPSLSIKPRLSEC
jgi:hypothetical protein